MGRHRGATCVADHYISRCIGMCHCHCGRSGGLAGGAAPGQGIWGLICAGRSERRVLPSVTSARSGVARFRLSGFRPRWSVPVGCHPRGEGGVSMVGRTGCARRDRAEGWRNRASAASGLVDPPCFGPQTRQRRGADRYGFTLPCRRTSVFVTLSCRDVTSRSSGDGARRTSRHCWRHRLRRTRTRFETATSRNPGTSTIHHAHCGW